jgi:hypothetical protein
MRKQPTTFHWRASPFLAGVSGETNDEQRETVGQARESKSRELDSVDSMVAVAD